VRDFSQAHPDVELRLHQGSPRQVAEWLDERRNTALVAIDARHRFASNMTRLAIKIRHLPACLSARRQYALRVAADACSEPGGGLAHPGSGRVADDWRTRMTRVAMQGARPRSPRHGLYSL